MTNVVQCSTCGLFITPNTDGRAWAHLCIGFFGDAPIPMARAMEPVILPPAPKLVRQARLDEFARAALTGMLSSGQELMDAWRPLTLEISDMSIWASIAYDLAEAMLAESARRAQQEKTT